MAKLCDARDTLCGFCEADECEKCIVAHQDGVVEVDEEQAIQKALAEAMRSCGCQHFVVAPPDLVKGGIQEVEE